MVLARHGFKLGKARQSYCVRHSVTTIASMDIQDFYAFLNVSRYLKRRIWNEQAVSSKGTKISDSELDLEILSWANERVAAAGKRRRITSFHDRSIASGLFLVSADAHSISFLFGSFSPVLLQSNELGAPQILC